MSKEIESKVVSILKKNVELKVDESKITPEDQLIRLGVNSITIIKVIIDIESEYGFEFSDEDLGLDKFKTIKDLVEHINRFQ